MSPNHLLADPADFEYSIKRQKRKSIALHVLTDASVEIRAPKWVAERELIQFVEQRVDWVVEQREKRLQQLANTPGFCQGEQHFYLGQRYPLTLREGTPNRNALIDNQLCLFVRDISCEGAVEKSLQQFYKSSAAILFQERMDHCYSMFPMQSLPYKPKPSIKLRKMRRRWGSCSSKGLVTLNTQLMKMPIKCIDYVIVHELCHLWEFNHSKAFYRLLSQAMPNWRECEKIIESIG